MSAIPLFKSSLHAYMPAIEEGLSRVARSGRYILGPEVEAFERDFAAYLGVAHCVGVANGTDALTIALRALGIGPGDEVVMPSFTFYATAEAAIMAGATPVFCDIDPRTFCVTRETVKAALTTQTKAIVPVHLFGNIAPVPQARVYGILKRDPVETPFSYAETYGDKAHSHPLYGEHFAVSDVPAGTYTVGAEIEGKKVFRVITVEAGKLTWVVFKP